MKKKLLHVVGARPNFMKVAPVVQAFSRYDGVSQTLVHTGQHYDINMSDVFFQELSLPKPDVNLEVGPGSHARQTADIIQRFEPVVLEHKPDLVLVYGDVNSTVATALVCSKLLIPVSHIEAGLRSFDRTMPEEINRLLTDQISDILLTPSADGDENLLREGIAPEKIHRVGNVMIDTLVRLLPVAAKADILEKLRLQPQGYGLVTLHRPSNVDEPKMFAQILEALQDISQDLPLVFPVHPRTRQRLQSLSQKHEPSNIFPIAPLSYLGFLALQHQATLIITDSGGIQEETTYLGIPCLTVRENTERPVTVSIGTNVLIGQDMEKLRAEAKKILSGEGKRGKIPPLWDGKAAERIAAVVLGQ